ncbi:MAG: hydrogenase 3 maturation endopeptidase HyCI [Spirochaetota bacterium]
METQCKKLILGIGNPLRSDDIAGSIVARKLKLLGLTGIDAEFMPENYIGVIRRNKPEKIIVVDCCDMNLPPGSVRNIPVHKIHSGIVTTHSLPLKAVMQQLLEITPNIMFIGIQPENIEVGDTVSDAVNTAIEQIVAIISSGNEDAIALL